MNKLGINSPRPLFSGCKAKGKVKRSVPESCGRMSRSACRLRKWHHLIFKKWW